MKVHALERPTRRALLAVALGCAVLGSAGCTDAPTLLPPPFGPKAGTLPRLFFPSGIAVAPLDNEGRGGQLLVANGNFNHAFEGGTVVSIDPGYIDSFFNAAPVDPTNPALPVPVNIPPSAFLGAARIGNYAGPLVFGNGADGGVSFNAFTGSRDTSILNAVTLDPATGALTCTNNPDAPKVTGTDGGVLGVDCYDGFLNTGDAFGLLGPYAIVPGFTRLPGSMDGAPDLPALFVSPLIPRIDGTIANTIYTSAPLAALDASNPSQALWSGDVSSFGVAGGIGGGPMVFDAQRRKLILAGCYTRFTGQTVGAPSSGKCSTTTSANLIRFIGVDEGANPSVEPVDIATTISSTDTEDIALGNFDPVTNFARTLFAITRTPDTLVEIDLPQDPTAQIQITRPPVSMPIYPANIVRLTRPPGIPGPDLIAVTLESSQSLAIYDTSTGSVVGQIEHLGIAPTRLVQLPLRPGDTTARLAVNVFQECRVALVDVNFARPWEVRLRGRLGSCPVAPQ
jgi:hypothetical protein